MVGQAEGQGEKKIPGKGEQEGQSLQGGLKPELKSPGAMRTAAGNEVGATEDHRESLGVQEHRTSHFAQGAPKDTLPSLEPNSLTELWATHQHPIPTGPWEPLPDHTLPRRPNRHSVLAQGVAQPCPTCCFQKQTYWKMDNAEARGRKELWNLADPTLNLPLSSAAF